MLIVKCSLISIIFPIVYPLQEPSRCVLQSVFMSSCHIVSFCTALFPPLLVDLLQPP
jgi:hypothetical protein